MASVFVDKNVSGGSDDGSTWEDARNDIQDAIDNASSGDNIYIATYGPDDPYDQGADLVPTAGLTFIGVEPGGTGTTVPDKAYVWVINDNNNEDVWDSNSGGSFEYIVSSATGTAGIGWNLDGTADWTFEHCRTESCVGIAWQLYNTGGTVTLRNCESYNDGTAGGIDAMDISTSGGTYDIQHCVIYNSGAYGVDLNANLDAGSVTFLQNIVVTDGSHTPLEIGAFADMAAGSPDFNAYETAIGAPTYATGTPSPAPANDVYAISDITEHLPGAAYGVLRLNRESSLVGAGWPNSHRREDIGIDGEYVEIIEPEYSTYVKSDGVGGSVGELILAGAIAAAEWRTALKFSLPPAISESDTILQAWLRLVCQNAGHANGRWILYPYGSDGYTNDPEQDAIADQYSRAASGTQMTRSLDIDGADGTEQLVFLEDPGVVETALGQGRNFSIGIAEDGGDHTGAYWYGHSSATVANRPLLILVYKPDKLAYRGGVEASLASQVLDYAELLAVL